MNCIFLNIETSVDNINSKDQKLGKIPRYYEEEAIRLIKSIKFFLPKIKIYTILFKDIEKYQDKTIKYLEKNTIISIPKLSEKIKKEINNFYSGFWFIPLSGLLMENSLDINKEINRLYDLNGVKIIPEQNALKLDSDMYLLQNPFNIFEFKFSLENNLEKPLVCYYDKDFGNDCKERLKYGINKMSNTCIIFSNLNNNIYNRWYNFLIEEDIYSDDLFEEVSFDILFPYTKTIPIVNIQIGENYLNYQNLNNLEKKKIIFFHQKIEKNIKDIKILYFLKKIRKELN